MNLATYTLQIFGPSPVLGAAEDETLHRLLGMDRRVLANLPAYVESWQEDMSDLLPEGYEVKIVEAMT